MCKRYDVVWEVAGVSGLYDRTVFATSAEEAIEIAKQTINNAEWFDVFEY